MPNDWRLAFLSVTQGDEEYLIALLFSGDEMNVIKLFDCKGLATDLF
jgi:hypothetical protein